MIFRSISMSFNASRQGLTFQDILKQMCSLSFTQDLTCVPNPLLSETMHPLQTQSGRGGRREAFKITALFRFLESVKKHEAASQPASLF